MDGVNVRVGDAAEFTVSETVVVWLKLPDVPVTVTVEVPVVAVLLADNAIVPAALNAAETPLGRPDALNATVPAKPFCGITVIVLEPLDP